MIGPASKNGREAIGTASRREAISNVPVLEAPVIQQHSAHSVHLQPYLSSHQIT